MHAQASEIINTVWSEYIYSDQAVYILRPPNSQIHVFFHIIIILFAVVIAQQMSGAAMYELVSHYFDILEASAPGKEWGLSSLGLDLHCFD